MGTRKPCAECPFSCTAKPGTLGGSTIQTYIGQAYGPFLLSCHMDPAYATDPRSPKLLPCAGAAIFRANVGVDVLMPKSMLRLPADNSLAFPTAAHFVAHHSEMSLLHAKVWLIAFPPQELLERELNRSGVRPVPNSED